MVPSKVTREFGLFKLKLYQNRDKVYFGLGMAGLVGGTILLCRGSRKLDGILDAHEEAMKKVKELPEDERKAATKKVWGHTIGRIAKEFGPGVAIWLAGAFGVSGSNYVLSADKHAALDALAMANATHNAFYKRVEKEIGAERAAELRDGVRNLTVTDTTSGEEESVKTEIEVKKASNPLQSVNTLIYGYGTSRYFDETNLPFNVKNILRARNEFESRIARNGYIIAGEVKTYLGVPRENITSSDWTSYKVFDPNKKIGQQLDWKIEELTKLEDLTKVCSGTPRDRAMLYDIRITFDFDKVMGKDMKLI